MDCKLARVLTALRPDKKRLWWSDFIVQIAEGW